MGIDRNTRLLVYGKFRGHCAYCGKGIEYKDMQVDHLTPVFRGGADDISNLMPSCRACNFRKGTWTLDEFREELRRQAGREMKRFQARQSADYGLIEYHDHPIVFYFETESY